jgi:hypothetical protein
MPNMPPISNALKYILIAFTVFCFAFMPFFLFFTEGFSLATQWPWLDPFFGRLYGVLLLAMGIGSILAILKKEWERIKIYIEFLMLWMFFVIILTVVMILTFSFSMVSLLLILVQAGLLSTFLLIFLFYYLIKYR